jgi:sigma-B regulation protein RsbU (phosphoserine phosphatase)
VAHLRDWLDLGKNTFHSLSKDDVASSYALEWTETKRALIADHRTSIEHEPRRVTRWARTISAIFYGLAKRLAPHRRVLFFVSQVAFFLSLFSIVSKTPNVSVWTFVELAATFLLMTLLLAMELIDKIKIRDELALARDLQASLIPRRPPETPQYEIAAFNHIANTVGGDIYDFVPLPDGRVAVLFGDASGHGMAAGLVMAVAHAAFRTQLDVDAAPAAVVGTLNRILCRTGSSRSFFSCAYILLSPDGEFVTTLAGHPPIVKIGADGSVVERIGLGAYPLGVKSGLRWDELRGTLAPGDRLLLHSDGLTEARANDQEFGDDYVDTISGWQPEAPAQTLVDTLVGEWRIFMGGRSAEDDVSIAVIRRR